MKGLLCTLLTINSLASPAQQIQQLISDTYPTNSGPGIAVSIRQESVNQTYCTGAANLNEDRLINEHTQFRLASVSKQFTSMAVYQLIRQGKISFDTPIIDILPELPTSTYAVRIGHLIQHSSGLLDYEAYIPSNQLDQVSDSDVLTILSQQDSVYFQAGSEFRYSNTGYCLLALIVERVSGQSFSIFCKERIFDLLGLGNSIIYKPSDSIVERAYGYHPNGGDYIFADQSLTSATQGDGGVYMSISSYNIWANTAQPLFDEQYLRDLENSKILVKDNIYYSLGWFVGYDEQDNMYLFHSGESTGFHNIVLFNFTKNSALFAFSNRDDQKIGDLFAQLGNNHAFHFSQIGSNNLFQWLSKVYANEL